MYRHYQYVVVLIFVLHVYLLKTFQNTTKIPPKHPQIPPKYPHAAAQAGGAPAALAEGSTRGRGNKPFSLAFHLYHMAHPICICVWHTPYFPTYNPITINYSLTPFDNPRRHQRRSSDGRWRWSPAEPTEPSKVAPVPERL